MIFNKNIGRESGEMLFRLPKIISAEFSVNPCGVNQEIVISVSVTEVFKVLYPEDYYSGEIYSDEV